MVIRVGQTTSTTEANTLQLKEVIKWQKEVYNNSLKFQKKVADIKSAYDNAK